MAANKVDMSLDDIIKKTKVGKGGRRGRGVSNNTQKINRGGRTRNGALNVPVRRTIGRRTRGVVGQRRTQAQRFTPRGNVDGVWTHDLYQGRPSTNGRVNSEGKLLISNLDFGVSESDIKELFSEFGQLKKSAVHFDFSGRSLGTAEVIFTSNQDAIKAMNRYNSVPLDGRPMNIQLVGSVQTRVQREPTTTRTFGSRAFIGGYTNTRGRGVSRGAVRGGRGTMRGGRGGVRGRGRGGATQPSLTKEQLDEQLDSYNKMDVE